LVKGEIVMTVKDMREFLNSIGTDYDDCSIVIFEENDKVVVDSVRRICSPMGKPCCIELKMKK
jgi:hypothetical protein